MVAGYLLFVIITSGFRVSIVCDNYKWFAGYLLFVIITSGFRVSIVCDNYR